MANTPGRSASPYEQGNNYGDPFADRPRQTQFVEQERPYHGSPNLMPRPFESSASLPSQEFGGPGNYDDEEIEKQPLNAGGSFTGGFYPPRYAFFHGFSKKSLTLSLQRQPRYLWRPLCRRAPFVGRHDI